MKKITYFILIIIACLFSMGLHFFFSYSIEECLCLFIFIVAIFIVAIAIYQLIKYERVFHRKRLKQFGFLGSIVILTLAIPAFIHILYFSNNGRTLTEEVILDFYGNYIVFLGTFILGYAVYFRDKEWRNEHKINFAKLLYTEMYSISNKLELLEKESAYLDRIEYDPQWKNYYNEIVSLGIQYESSLRIQIEKFFKHVDDVDYFLQKGEREKAIDCHRNYIKHQQYSKLDYNWIEAQCEVYEIAYLQELRSLHKNWKEENEKNISKFSEKYFTEIETYVWTFMVNHNLKCLGCEEIEYQLVEWLLQSAELKQLITSPYDKRIISQIVFEANLKMKEKSEKLNYCWAEYTIKEKA